MGETWEKVRSLMRGAFTPSADAPADPPVAPRTTTPAALRPAPVVRREIEPVLTGGDEPVSVRVALRTIDAKTDAAQARLDKLESTLQAAAESPSVPAGVIGNEIAALRTSIESAIAGQNELREMTMLIKQHVADLALAVTAIETRAAEMTRIIHEAQASAEEAIEEVDRARDDFTHHAATRAREVGGRLAPLYVVSFIALIAALGTAILMAVELFNQ